MKNYKDFNLQKEVLLEYLQVMIALQDWHGVADVAMDLRELEARNPITYAKSPRERTSMSGGQTLCRSNQEAG